MCPSRRRAAVAMKPPSLRSGSVRVWFTMNVGPVAADLLLEPLGRAAVCLAPRGRGRAPPAAGRPGW